MTIITTRAGKGSPLTNNELDANFINLNTYKVEQDANGNATVNALTANGLIYNKSVINSNVTIPNGYNAVSVGPIVETAMGVTVTVSDNASWSTI